MCVRPQCSGIYHEHNHFCRCSAVKRLGLELEVLCVREETNECKITSTTLNEDRPSADLGLHFPTSLGQCKIVNYISKRTLIVPPSAPRTHRSSRAFVPARTLPAQAVRSLAEQPPAVATGTLTQCRTRPWRLEQQQRVQYAARGVPPDLVRHQLGQHFHLATAARSLLLWWS